MLQYSVSRLAGFEHWILSKTIGKLREQRIIVWVKIWKDFSQDRWNSSAYDLKITSL